MLAQEAFPGQHGQSTRKRRGETKVRGIPTRKGPKVVKSGSIDWREMRKNSESQARLMQGIPPRPKSALYQKRNERSLERKQESACRKSRAYLSV